jgi:hypothetical protein
LILTKTLMSSQRSPKKNPYSLPSPKNSRLHNNLPQANSVHLQPSNNPNLSRSNLNLNVFPLSQDKDLLHISNPLPLADLSPVKLSAFRVLLRLV